MRKRKKMKIKCVFFESKKKMQKKILRKFAYFLECTRSLQRSRSHAFTAHQNFYTIRLVANAFAAIWHARPIQTR